MTTLASNRNHANQGIWFLLQVSNDFVSRRFCNWKAGRHPTYRHDNVKFENSNLIGDKKRAKRARQRLRSKGMCGQKRGDWSWLKQCCGLTGWGDKKDKRVCWLCKAQKADLRDASLNARWRHTVNFNPDWFLEQLLVGGFISSIFLIPGFLAKYFSIDVMHCVCLGILQIFEGNLLYEIFLEMGGTPYMKKPNDIMTPLNALLCSAAKAIGHDMPVYFITLRMLKPEKASKGPTAKLKAAESRRLLPICVALLEMYFPPQDARERLRLNAAKMLNSFYVEMKNWDADASPFKLGSILRSYTALYVELGDATLAQWPDMTYWPWKLIPKNHIILHAVEIQVAQYGNPKLSWCYMDESAMGRCIELAESVHVSYIHRAVINKYRL